MHRNRKVRAGTGVLAIAGAVALVGAVLPGAALAQDKAEIVWSTWGNPEELGRFDEFNAAFMERHPDIDVKLQPVPSYSDYHSKLLAQLISGTAPDLFYIGDDNIGKFVDSGVLLPVNDLLAAEDSQISADDFIDALYGAAAKDGQIYGIPVDSNPDVLWYDKQALEAAGITEDPAELAANNEWTTAKFLEMIDALTAADKLGAIFWNYWATHH